MGNLHVRGPREVFLRHKLRYLKKNIEEAILGFTVTRFCAHRHDVEPTLERLAWIRSDVIRTLKFEDTCTALNWYYQKALREYSELIEADNRAEEVRARERLGLPPQHAA